MREFFQPQASVVHALDARVKVILSLAFIVFVNLMPESPWPAMVFFFTFTLSTALIANLGLSFLLKRSLIAFPFLLAATPIIFTGKSPHLPLPIFPALMLNYSPAGLQLFITIALKAWISVQAAILLTATTRFLDILYALQQLRMPRLWLMVIALMWRYLFILMEEVTRMLQARSSRNAAAPGKNKSQGSLAWRARVTGTMAGSLFVRSIERSERVYQAMLSRGYDGKLRAVRVQPIPVKECGILIFILLGFVLVWMFSLMSAG